MLVCFKGIFAFPVASFLRAGASVFDTY